MAEFPKHYDFGFQVIWLHPLSSAENASTPAWKMKPRVTKILKIYNSKFLRGYLKRAKKNAKVETNKRPSPHSTDIGTFAQQGGRPNAHRNTYVFSLVQAAFRAWDLGLTVQNPQTINERKATIYRALAMCGRRTVRDQTCFISVAPHSP